MDLDIDTTEVIIVIIEPIITGEAATTVKQTPLALPITKAKTGVLNLLLLKKMYGAERIEVHPH